MREFTGIAHIDVLLADADETPSRQGNPIRQIFYSADRYLFDFNLDLDEGAWTQLDTDSDASYFGVWVNKTTRQILQYVEGDISFTQCTDAESYDSELEALCSSHDTRPAFIAVGDDDVAAYYQDRGELFIDPARGKAYRFVGGDEGGE